MPPQDPSARATAVTTRSARTSRPPAPGESPRRRTLLRGEPSDQRVLPFLGARPPARQHRTTPHDTALGDLNSISRRRFDRRGREKRIRRMLSSCVGENKEFARQYPLRRARGGADSSGHAGRTATRGWLRYRGVAQEDCHRVGALPTSPSLSVRGAGGGRISSRTCLTRSPAGVCQPARLTSGGDPSRGAAASHTTARRSPAFTFSQPSSGASVHVAPVVDAQHDNLAKAVVDPVEDSVGATASRVDTCQVAPQLLPDPCGIGDQGAGHELDDCSRHGFREIALDGSDGRRGQDQFIGAGLGHPRRDRTASTPRTTSRLR